MASLSIAINIYDIHASSSRTSQLVKSVIVTPGKAGNLIVYCTFLIFMRFYLSIPVVQLITTGTFVLFIVDANIYHLPECHEISGQAAETSKAKRFGKAVDTLDGMATI